MKPGKKQEPGEYGYKCRYGNGYGYGYRNSHNHEYSYSHRYECADKGTATDENIGSNDYAFTAENIESKSAMPAGLDTTKYDKGNTAITVRYSRTPAAVRTGKGPKNYFTCGLRSGPTSAIASWNSATSSKLL